MKVAFWTFIAALSFVAFGAQAGEVENVTMCRIQAPGLAPVYIAEKQGYFEQQGLHVIFQETVNGKICQDNLLAGNADFGAGIAEGVFAYIGFHDHKLRLLAQIGVNPQTSLYARKDHGITKAKDIKGKRIGYLPGTPSYLYLAHLLDKLGLTFADIKSVPLQPPAMPQALTGGLIDGFVMWEPWGNMAMTRLGNKAVFIHDSGLYDLRAAIIAPEAVIKSRPGVIKKVLQALIQAEGYIKEHPTETQQQIAQATKVDEFLLKRDWGGFDFTVKLDSSLIDLMVADAKYIKRDDSNFKNLPLPDYRLFVDPDFLSEIAPGRVKF